MTYVAFFVGSLSVFLFVMSRYEQRAETVPTWFPWMIRAVSVAILVLASIYLYNWFVT